MAAADLPTDMGQPIISFPPWYMPDLPFPKQDDRVHARKVLTFTNHISMKVWVNKLEDGEEIDEYEEVIMQDWVKRQLEKAKDLFPDQKLIDRIRASFDKHAPGKDMPVPSAALLNDFTKVQVEDMSGPLSSIWASSVLRNIARFLHSEPEEKDEGFLTLYRDVEAAISKYVSDLSTPILSEWKEFPKERWELLELLAWFGEMQTKPFRTAVFELAQKAPKAPNCQTNYGDLLSAAGNPYRLAQLLIRPNITIPEGWEWPKQDSAGIYWWRALYRHHLVDHILSYKDTADFHVTDLLRFVFRAKLFTSGPDRRVPPYVSAAIAASLKRFKYWLDGQPEYDREQQIKENNSAAEMAFWSENHTIQFASAQVLVGQLFPDAIFPRSARGSEELDGKTLAERGRKLLDRWLSDRLRFGFSEWNAPGYYNEDFPPLFNVADFCADKKLSKKSAMVLDVLIFDLARFNSRGSFGTTAGRAYFESKVYGWGQSVGNTIEILFGTRGDFYAGENTAIALATSGYEVPHALIAIGLDRVYNDHHAPLDDRSRVSINRGEAGNFGIGFKEDTDVAYWWSTGAYFTEETLAGTRRVVEKYDNLRKTSPFYALYPDPDLPWYAALVDVILKLARTPIAGDVVEAGAGAGLARAGSAGLALALPFPLNVMSWGVAAAGTLMLVKGIANYIADFWKTGVRLVEKIFGSDDDDEPVVPPSTVTRFLESLVKTFNEGTTLSRANIRTFCNGDALLGSVQNHLKGKIAFQKCAWQATIDCEANVWTSTPPVNVKPFLEGLVDAVGTHLRAWLQFFKDLFQLRPISALFDLALPLLPEDFFGHDGPNHWTGDFALPMIVQHESAAIIAYNIPNLQRTLEAAATHAWFPKAMFDESTLRNKGEGTWIFGRKRDGFVALYSARKVEWNKDGPYKDKEIYAEGGSNIWICMIGNTQRFSGGEEEAGRAVELGTKRIRTKEEEDELEELRAAAFEAFINEILDAYLSISGVDSPVQLHCSFDMPRTTAPPGRTPRLELFYNDDEGRFAGDKLQLDEFPRFENKYCRVEFGARRYTIRHPDTKLELSHDLDIPRRDHTRQPFKIKPLTRKPHLNKPAAAATREPLVTAKARAFRRRIRYA
jgi:hypothetical protein